MGHGVIVAHWKTSDTAEIRRAHTEVVQLRWEILVLVVYNQIDNLLLAAPIIILSRKLLKSKPFTVNVADVLQRECVESCLDIPIAKKLNPVGISILNVSEHII